jgi:RNA polymerase sigma-70 factor (ECF subfamily)
MDETRQSLLIRAQAGEADAWKDLLDLYRPLILSWLNRQGVPPCDLEDLSQEVLLSVVKNLPGYEHSGNRGAFRSWLRTIVCRRTADYWRALDAATQAQGGSGTTVALQQITDPDSDLNRQWDEEHDLYVVNRLLDRWRRSSSRSRSKPSDASPSTASVAQRRPRSWGYL